MKAWQMLTDDAGYLGISVVLLFSCLLFFLFCFFVWVFFFVCFFFFFFFLHMTR